MGYDYAYYEKEGRPEPGTDKAMFTHFNKSKEHRRRTIYIHSGGKIIIAVEREGAFDILEFDSLDNPLTNFEREFSQLLLRDIDTEKASKKFDGIVAQYRVKSGLAAYADFIEYEGYVFQKASPKQLVLPLLNLPMMLNWYKKQVKIRVKKAGVTSITDKNEIESGFIEQRLQFHQKIDFGYRKIEDPSGKELRILLVNKKFLDFLNKRSDEINDSTKNVGIDEAIRSIEPDIQDVENPQINYFTRQEAAIKLKVDVSTVDRWRKAGIIESRTVGRTVRIPESEINHQQKYKKKYGRYRE